jgi:trans-2,3-dihydro-3-hydroxyanthranilate isomerase
MSTSARSISYAIFDVFAESALQGNCLAVFTDARGLSTGEMQDLARETNLSETTFILPRSPEIEQERGVHVRIFTTQEELPFAGHPTLGTAAWVHLYHPVLRGQQTVTLELAVGQIPVTFGDGVGPGVFGTMRQNDPVFGQVHSRTVVADVLGLTLADLDPDLPVQTVSTGLPFCIVPLRSLEVAQRLAIPQQRAVRYLAQTDAKFFHCISPADPASGAQWHARMQFYNGEDPATGSASGCAIAYLVANSLVSGGEQIILEQGVEMKRPSRIYVRASREDLRIRDVYVGGRTILTAMGSFFL